MGPQTCRRNLLLLVVRKNWLKSWASIYQLQPITNSDKLSDVDWERLLDGNFSALIAKSLPSTNDMLGAAERKRDAAIQEVQRMHG
jgi:hypothetical protein